jgi:hypothetical protein
MGEKKLLENLCLAHYEGRRRLGKQAYMENNITMVLKSKRCMWTGFVWLRADFRDMLSLRCA